MVGTLLESSCLRNYRFQDCPTFCPTLGRIVGIFGSHGTILGEFGTSNDKGFG